MKIKKPALRVLKAGCGKVFSVVHAGFYRGKKIIHHISGGGLRRFDAVSIDDLYGRTLKHFKG